MEEDEDKLVRNLKVKQRKLQKLEHKKIDLEIKQFKEKSFTISQNVINPSKVKERAILSHYL